MREHRGGGRSRAAILAAAIAGVVALGAGGGQPAAAASCPTRVAPGAFASTADLRRDNVTEWSFGHPRPTGGVAQQRLIAWIERRLHAIPGVRLGAQRFTIRRWDERSTSLRVVIGGRAVELPVAGPIPYAHPTTGRGATAPLAFVPDGQAMTAANARGRIVVRNAPAGSRPVLGVLPRRPRAGRSSTRATRSTAARASAATSSTTTPGSRTSATPPPPGRPGCCSSRTCRDPRSATTTSPTRASSGASPARSSAPTRASASATRWPPGRRRRPRSSCAPGSTASSRAACWRRSRAAVAAAS